MIARGAVFLLLASLAAGCGSTSRGEGNGDGTTNPQSGEVADGHTLTLTADLKARDGKASFMTPSVTLVDIPTEKLVGKPYLVAAFKAGFSPGNDPALDATWGTVPADLKITYTTPHKYPDGPYDMVLVVYVSTPISEEMKAKPAHLAPAAKGGDLATFTFGVDDVNMKPGDPTIIPGVVRLNLAGSDASLLIENRTPKDPTDQVELQTSFMNTILVVP